jgi:hypothetical protein
MKRFALAVALGLSLSAPSIAHDEGHGPMLTDQGKQGGVMASVIDVKDSKKGAKAAVVYKAELVRSEDGTVRVYLYDKAMTPLDLAKFDAAAKGIVETEKKKKFTRTPFSLKQEDGAFVGTAPKAPMKPFNIDVTLKEGTRELLTAFDNLD